MQLPASESTTGSAPTAAEPRPKSCVNGWIALSGLVSFLLSLALMYGSSLSSMHRSLVAMAATAGPMIVLDLLVLRVHRRASTGLVWAPTGTAAASADAAALGRVLVKLTGLAGTLAIIGGCYWLFPIYREPFYEPYWSALRTVAPWFAIAAPLYFLYLDRRMAEPRDGYWHAGMVVLGRIERVDGAQLRQFALGWIIKGYFLPLMFVYFTNTIDNVLNSNFLTGYLGSSFLPIYRFAWNLAFATDLAFAAIGYCLTMRLTDSHIRWPEPTMLGWAVTLACYQPFSNVILGQYLVYNDDLSWSGWLTELPWLKTMWGIAILTLLSIYAGSTVMFGCRFSNLTHRGILTQGPYRWTKHPSYISKNLMWWLVSVPFISTAGFDEAARHSLLLLGVNFVYFMRARTEERQLSRDPQYVAYALWIDRHGLLRMIGRAMPLLRYARPIG